jgi:hypothetical protein
MATKTSRTCAHTQFGLDRDYIIDMPAHASKTELRAGGGPTAASGFTSPALRVPRLTSNRKGAHLAGAPICKIPGAEGFASLSLTMPGRSRRMGASKGVVRVESAVRGRGGGL